VAECIRDELVGHDPELLRGRSVEGECVRQDGHGNGRARRDAADERAAVDPILSFGEQAVHGRDRADARCGLVECCPFGAVGAPEEE
jgi:hypothetical protein